MGAFSYFLWGGGGNFFPTVVSPQERSSSLKRDATLLSAEVTRLQRRIVALGEATDENRQDLGPPCAKKGGGLSAAQHRA